MIQQPGARVGQLVENQRAALSGKRRLLSAYDPVRTLERGWSLTLDDQGRLHLRGFLRAPLLGTALGSTQIWTAYTGRVTAECRIAGD